MEKKINELLLVFHANATVEGLEVACGRDFDGLGEAIMVVKEILLLVLRSVTDLVEIISCDSIVPIYQTAVYDATCSYSMKALIWAFAAGLIASMFGFLMVLLRASFSETCFTYKYVNTSTSNDKDHALISGIDGTLETAPAALALRDVTPTYDKSDE
jgi:hypothetical protein